MKTQTRKELNVKASFKENDFEQKNLMLRESFKEIFFSEKKTGKNVLIKKLFNSLLSLKEAFLHYQNKNNDKDFFYFQLENEYSYLLFIKKDSSLRLNTDLKFYDCIERVYNLGNISIKETPSSIRGVNKHILNSSTFGYLCKVVNRKELDLFLTQISKNETFLSTYLDEISVGEQKKLHEDGILYFDKLKGKILGKMEDNFFCLKLHDISKSINDDRFLLFFIKSSIFSNLLKKNKDIINFFKIFNHSENKNGFDFLEYDGLGISVHNNNSRFSELDENFYYKKGDCGIADFIFEKNSITLDVQQPLLSINVKKIRL